MSTLNNATKSRFMERTSEFSTVASRRGANLLGWDRVENEHISLTQQRDILKARIEWIEARRAELPHCQERDRLGKEKLELQGRLSEIKERLKGSHSVNEWMLSIFRDMVGDAEFERVRKLAWHRKLMHETPSLVPIQNEAAP